MAGHEIDFSPTPRKPYEEFGLTKEEVLSWRVSQERFAEFIADEGTSIHEVKESSNTFGEFLFVTASRRGQQKPICMTFYGLGYHENRERWVTEEWFWYQNDYRPSLLEQRIEKEEALELLKRRSESIQSDIDLETQTERGRLFEFLADLTDDDAALAEVNDLDDIVGSL